VATPDIWQLIGAGQGPTVTPTYYSCHAFIAHGQATENGQSPGKSETAKRDGKDRLTTGSTESLPALSNL
jgi:hypothetical protein